MRILSTRFRFVRDCGSCALAALLFTGCKSTEIADTEVGAADYPPAAIPEVKEEPPKPSSAGFGRSRSSSIRPGDTLELFVEEDESFNGKYPVREGGDIIIPSVGRIPVSGMSVVDAGSRVRSKLESSHLKKATVILDRVSRAPAPEPAAGAPPGPSRGKTLLTVYMTGKVARAGQHRIPLPESGELGVYEAILIAGGLSQFADPAKVHLLREDEAGRKHKIPVNIRAIENGLATDPAIGDGDIVVVPEKVFGF